jgi:protein-tyrosine phosphatase
MYGGIFADGSEADSFGSRGKKTIAELFRCFCDRRNYPIYFHCQGGADRTGALAYILCGVLGVSKHDLDVDWEQTFYPTLPAMEKGNWRSLACFDKGFAKYGGDDTPLHERVRRFLLDCGVTDKEIRVFRSIMLEPAQVKVKE